MVKNEKLLVVLLIALALSLGMVRPLAAAGPVLVAPISFEGYVYLDVRPGFSGTILELYARRGVDFVPGLVVRLEDRMATYDRNTYSCLYDGLRPAPGSIVTVSIQKPGLAPGLRPEVLRVTGTVPPWLGITSPRDGAMVATTGARTLDVAWSGGHSPYALVIREVTSRKVLLKVDALAGTSYSVPMGIFTPGTKCRLTVVGTERKMLFSEPAGASSSFKLGQIHSIVFGLE